MKKSCALVLILVLIVVLNGCSLFVVSEQTVKTTQRSSKVESKLTTTETESHATSSSEKVSSKHYPKIVFKDKKYSILFSRVDFVNPMVFVENISDNIDDPWQLKYGVSDFIPTGEHTGHYKFSVIDSDGSEAVLS